VGKRRLRCRGINVGEEKVQIGHRLGMKKSGKKLYKGSKTTRIIRAKGQDLAYEISD